MTARIDGVEERLNSRIDGVERKLTARIDGLAVDLQEVRVAVARIDERLNIVERGGQDGARLVIAHH